MKIYLLTSSDREHGGKVIHGVFSTSEKAWEARVEDYYRIYQVDKLEVDVAINLD